METLNTPFLDWGVATRTLPGQIACGDHYVVKPVQNDVLVAAVDGLGHGDEAATAARLAVSRLERYAHESVIALARLCHQGLLATRGVVMSLAKFNSLDETMTWVGVGNVQGRLLRATNGPRPLLRESLLLRGGVVGGQLPPLCASILPIMPGDMLIFATDGVSSGFDEGVILDRPPQEIADWILARHSRGTDDALVLVARYLGAAALARGVL